MFKSITIFKQLQSYSSIMNLLERYTPLLCNNLIEEIIHFHYFHSRGVKIFHFHYLMFTQCPNTNSVSIPVCTLSLCTIIVSIFLTKGFLLWSPGISLKKVSNLLLLFVDQNGKVASMMVMKAEG